jgi:hypothetical protein
MDSKGNHPQMALIQVSEILQFTQILYTYQGCPKPFLWRIMASASFFVLGAAFDENIPRKFHQIPFNTH